MTSERLLTNLPVSLLCEPIFETDMVKLTIITLNHIGRG